MTLLQFARAECANFDQTTGGCKGIGIKDDGKLYSFGTKPACVLGNRIPCPYFEECVIPMGIELINARNVQIAKQREDAVYQYSMFATSFSKAGRRPCPVCGEFKVEPRHQLCAMCARKRETQRARAAMQERRSHVTNLAEKPSQILNEIEGKSGSEGENG